jgi:acetyl esterase
VARHADEIDGDGGRIAVGGDSAFGNLAAVVTHLLRDDNSPRLAFQLLVYPVTEYLADTPSA